MRVLPLVMGYLSVAQRQVVAPSTALNGECPEGFSNCGPGDHCYRIVHSAVSWGTAKDDCLARNTTLASLRNPEAQQCLTRLNSAVNSALWIGLFKKTADSPWTWENGANTSYQNWAVGHPDSPSRDFCGLMRMGAVWDDWHCDQPPSAWQGKPYTAGYICESPKVALPSSEDSDDDSDGPTTQYPSNCLSETKPISVSCSRGHVTTPTIDLDNDPIVATRTEFAGDQSNKCRHLAYRLHRWVVLAARGGGGEGDRPRRSASGGDMTVSCHGKGILRLSEVDEDAGETVNLTVDIVATLKCREFFGRFLEELLQLQ
ncbi:hypothetical protein BV898_02366 [Hypsibius exemplaris]|uniref:C-type lectin domain-containing protein n=1 Tax=Hypsibius exemplaris TaxID=2072580 RepID=A0A1W0X7Z3_HYPEX|nr:hypothetical protein BV898_02366 [Hypsibius exemplaris]